MGEVYCLQENNIESKDQSKFSEFITDKRKIIICTASVLVIILAATIGYIFSIKTKVASWDNRIYSGVSIYDRIRIFKRTERFRKPDPRHRGVSKKL